MIGYEEIEFGTRSNRFDCVFVWIYARNCTPYAGYPYNDIPNVSLVLTELRWDGLFGAVGGAVEDDDLNLEVAIHRESMEEIAYDLPIERLEPLATYKNTISGSHIHSYSLEVTYEELLEIRKNAYDGVHFNPENAGINLLHICRYLKSGKIECGWNTVLEQNFVSTSKLELMKLVRTKNLLIDYVDDSAGTKGSYKMFIDDIRDVNMYYPYDEFVVVRSYKDAVQYVTEHGLPSFVSFDHDLGDTESENEETGYTFAKYLVEYMMDNQIAVPFEYHVHSANPVGAMNIMSYLENAFKFIRSL
ncbi:hypothetical protein [Yersinia phage fHe-Yen9-04]|uniref:Cyclic-phosphate processing Receiver domain-containing protein n=2 Tax=Eneladusvirus Yen904 TaxID=2560849 RepID=A0A2C9CX55_9CAUD|nr:nudix hydrolase [Yersinia phage fHe-Yen9-04]SOK58383.1 hypothetical protein [Yersinia phage fHe-Yen9-04]SOK58918.1 hypothetical protein [Yersinia phage fHe-Yen9-03]VUE36152.1 hypothetical protein [Yersinia phage fHe-Yen9-04]